MLLISALDYFKFALIPSSKYFIFTWIQSHFIGIFLPKSPWLGNMNMFLIQHFIHKAWKTCTPQCCHCGYITSGRPEPPSSREAVPQMGWGGCNITGLYNSLGAAESQMLQHFTSVGSSTPALSAPQLRASSHRALQCF